MNWRRQVGVIFGQAGTVDIPAPSTSIRYRWSLLLGTAILIAVILVLRLPTAIFHPFFISEDGAVFFRQAYQDPGLHNLFLFWCGYPRFMPRLLAELSCHFPLRQVPLVDALLSLTIMSFCLSFFALPLFRHIVRSDWLRAAVCLMFSIGPNLERIMCIDPISWVLLLFISLSVLMVFDNRGWIWLAYSVLSLMVIFSTPLTSPLVVLYALRLAVATTWKEKAWLLICIAGIFINIVVCDHDSAAIMNQLGVLLESLINGLCYRVINAVAIGIIPARLLLGENSWLPTYLVAGIVVAFAAYLAAGLKERNRLPVILSLLYMMLSTYVMFLYRTEYVLDYWTITDHTRYWGERYFEVQSFLFMILAASLIEGRLTVLALKGTSRFFLGLCAVGFVCLHLLNFRSGAPVLYDTSQNWDHDVDLIEQAQAATDRDHVIRYLTFRENSAFSIYLETKLPK